MFYFLIGALPRTPLEGHCPSRPPRSPRRQQLLAGTKKNTWLQKKNTLQIVEFLIQLAVPIFCSSSYRSISVSKKTRCFVLQEWFVCLYFVWRYVLYKYARLPKCATRKRDELKQLSGKSISGHAKPLGA